MIAIGPDRPESEPTEAGLRQLSHVSHVDFVSLVSSSHSRGSHRIRHAAYDAVAPSNDQFDPRPFASVPCMDQVVH